MTSLYNIALKHTHTLPASHRDKPRPASDRERMTSLYNIACCHSQLGDTRSGLVALSGEFDKGLSFMRLLCGAHTLVRECTGVNRF